MERLTIVILMFFSLYDVFPQEENYTSKYCLDFYCNNPNCGEWVHSSNNMSLEQLRIDGAGTTYTDDKNCLRIRSYTYPTDDPNRWNYRDRLSIALLLQKKILIPVKLAASSKVEFVLTCKSENLKQLDLLILEYDDREKLLHIDTLHALDNSGDKKWHCFKKEIHPLENMAFCCFRLIAEGIDSTYNKDPILPGGGRGHIDSTLNEDLFLHRIDIYIDGRHIDEYCVDGRATPINISKGEVIGLSFKENNCYEKIGDLQNRRIVGIGETVHGSETMAASAVELMKHQVQHNGCKLILLEKTSEEMLLFNRFVQGDESIEIDSIMQNFTNPSGGTLTNLFSTKQLKNLCLWLKEYNKKAESKVWLLGVDNEMQVQPRLTAIADFLSIINFQMQSDKADEICGLLLGEISGEGKNGLAKANEIFNGIKNDFIRCVGEENFAIVKYYLGQIMESFKRDKAGSPFSRDSMMAANACFLEGLLCDDKSSVVIQAHYMHTNYNYAYTYPTMGFYLRQKYGDDFFSITLAAAEGSCSTIGFNVEKTELSPPISHSIEKSLNDVGVDYLYFPTSAKGGFAAIRDVGLQAKDCSQFRHGYVSLQGRTGGFVFIKVSEPAAQTITPNVAYPELRREQIKMRIQNRNAPIYKKCSVKSRFFLFCITMLVLATVLYKTLKIIKASHKKRNMP